MKFVLAVVLAASLFGLSKPTLAESSHRRWKIEETLPNGLVEVRVIEDVGSERQEVLSQRMIFKKMMSKAEASHFEFIADINVPKFKPGKPLWEISKPQWTASDEEDYSQWISTQVTTDFLSGAGLKGDCANIGLLFRWVYARDHKLPIANTMTGSGRLFGHFSGSADWDELAQDPDWKKDERFKAALRYLFDNTYTHTVVDDLYPTLVSPEFVRPGSVFMIIRPSSGHTQTIQKVDLGAGISTIWGNEPASSSIYSSPLIIEVKHKQTFGLWRYVEHVSGPNGAVWRLIAPEKMVGYSASQFGQTFTDADVLEDWINSRLGIHIPDPVRLNSLLKEFQENLFMRNVLVASSLPDCYLKTCDSSSESFEDYSTFSRDARLKTEQSQVLALISKMGNHNPDVVQALEQFPSEEVIPGSALTYLDLLEDPKALNRLNPDPRVSFAERWGISGSDLTPTIMLNGDATALLELLAFRRVYVQQGAALCKDGCDPHSASTQMFNTASLDGGIQSVLRLVLDDSHANGLEAGAFANMRLRYTKESLHVSSPNCPDSVGECTFDDAVFASGAKERLSHWSANPWDSADLRWGF